MAIAMSFRPRSARASARESSSMAASITAAPEPQEREATSASTIAGRAAHAASSDASRCLRPARQSARGRERGSLQTALAIPPSWILPRETSTRWQANWLGRLTPPAIRSPARFSKRRLNCFRRGWATLSTYSIPTSLLWAAEWQPCSSRSSGRLRIACRAGASIPASLRFRC